MPGSGEISQPRLTRGEGSKSKNFMKGTAK